MSPKGYMWMGIFILTFCIVMTFVGGYSAQAVFLTFGAGAMFGKGYGVWEERAAKDV